MSADLIEKRALAWLESVQLELTEAERDAWSRFVERIADRLMRSLDEATEGELEKLARVCSREKLDAVMRRFTDVLGPRLVTMFRDEATRIASADAAGRRAPRRTVDIAAPRGDGDRQARLRAQRVKVLAKSKGRG